MFWRKKKKKVKKRNLVKIKKKNKLQIKEDIFTSQFNHSFCSVV